MSIFKRRHKNKAGKVIPAGVYTVEFKDHSDTYRRVAGFRDKAATEEFERNLVKLVAHRRAGLPPRPPNPRPSRPRQGSFSRSSGGLRR